MLCTQGGCTLFAKPCVGYKGRPGGLQGQALEVHGTKLQRNLLARLQGRPYAWAAEDKPLTTLTRGGCKRCGVFEDRRIPFIDVRPLTSD